jgi:hypothetical protein
VNTDGEIRAVQFTEPTAAALVGIADGRGTFVVEPEAMFGTESHTNAAGFAPGAKDVDIELLFGVPRLFQRLVVLGDGLKFHALPGVKLSGSVLRSHKGTLLSSIATGFDDIKTRSGNILPNRVFTKGNITHYATMWQAPFSLAR